MVSVSGTVTVTVIPVAVAVIPVPVAITVVPVSEVIDAGLIAVSQTTLVIAALVPAPI